VQVSRKGAFVFVAGALALGEQGVLVGAGDPAHQARQCLLNIEAGLSKAGARLEDLVRTRVYVRSVRYWPAVLQVFTEVLGKERPVNTVIEVQALVDPAALVAIEADAMVGH
jgi:enamine deaminase RidA (YjgF/YER057c/UK114 family)